MAYTSPDFPKDVQTLPNADAIIRQTDCQYQFGAEAVRLTLKFMGDTNEAVKLAANYRTGKRIPLNTLTTDFSEFNTNIFPQGGAEVWSSGKVLSSVFSSRAGAGAVTVVVELPYNEKMEIGGSSSDSDPEQKITITWQEKSTNYEFPIEIYAGEDDPNAAELDKWKKEKDINIDNYKAFCYSQKNDAGDDVTVPLTGKTLELAKKIYRGVESVSRAYPEVIRITQYQYLKCTKDKGDTKYGVNKHLIEKIEPKTGGVELYHRDPTPKAIWEGKFPGSKQGEGANAKASGYDWLYASYDVNIEPTEYENFYNATVTESWIGIDIGERGTWDDNLYGNGNPPRWPFAGQASTPDPKGNYSNGAPVTKSDVNNDGRIKNTTFQNQNDIQTINVGSEFYAVDANAFKATPTRSATAGVPDLQNITMPNVSFIGDDAFNGAANLTSISLPNQISYLGERVFKDCTSLSTAYITPSIYTLPASTFEGCTSLDITHSEPVTLGGIINSIGDNAFKGCTKLSQVKCENAITSIGANAFENDDALTSFSMGLNSTGSITIGDEAFKGCSALADIELPVPTITLGTDSFLNAFAEEVTVQAPKSFLANLPGTSSYNYIYPAFVDTMASAEWQNDTRLLSAVVCDAITSIPENAFRGCTNCTSVTLPDTVTSLGHDAFRQSGITSFVTPPMITGTLVYNMFYQCTALESVDFNNATILGADIFAGCTSLTQLFNEDKLTSIQARAFSDCAFVEFNGGSGLAGLGQSCFRRNAALKSFKIPENETRSLTIGATAFDSCTALERIEIPVGGTMTIGTTIFNNGLASEIWLKAPFNSTLIASIPSSKRINFIYPSFTTSIASAEWQNSVKIKSAAIPGGVTSVGANAFDGCTNLTEITMADKDIATVQVMANYPFGLTTGQVIHCSDGDITI